MRRRARPRNVEVKAVAAALLLYAGPVSAANETVCHPESIIAELDRKNPATTAKILRDAGAVVNSEAMLWRVERSGTPVSHLFGTVHIPDRTLTTLSPQTLTALRASKIVALEASEVPRHHMQGIMAEAGPLMSARDKPLQSALDEDELKVVERSIMQAGYPAELALGIRPWVATMFLTGSACQDANADMKPLDLLVADEARRVGIEVTGLETMLEQFRSLASIDDAVQVAWLKASIATHDRLDDIAHTVAELYRFRRVDAVWQLTRELAPTAQLTDADLSAIRRGLVGQRNARLLQRSLPLVEAGGAFIAVGALHLSAPDGLVEELRRLGYTLHPIE